VLDVAADALHRASSASLMAKCTSSDSTPDALTVGLVLASGVRVIYNPLLVWDRTHPSGFGARSIYRPP